MISRIQFFISRLGERLWVRPLAMCALSLLAAFFVKLADQAVIPWNVPDISPETIETLLKTLSASMLVIATFAVGSMVSSYASAGNSATPRAFALIVADDISQNALSIFIGAFIFSIVTLIALLNEYYGDGGLFALFCLTLLVFALVILTFVRWVDSIARLGRMRTTIEKVEAATAKAFSERRRAPTFGGLRASSPPEGSLAIQGETVGYVQRIDMQMLQAYAEAYALRIEVTVLPGTFITPDRPLANVVRDATSTGEIDPSRIIKAFVIGNQRTFDEDPRFGLVVFSEIAGRALSPAVNDPGTAIDVIGTLVRLFVNWSEPLEKEGLNACDYDRIAVPELSVHDMFQDAFTAIARDGAGTLEVGIRLQKALKALAVAGDSHMGDAARHQSRLAMARAELALKLPSDLEAIRELGKFASQP